MKLPLKTRILEYGIEKKEPFTISDLMHDLAEEYEGERQFTEKIIENYIMAYCGVNILEAQVVNSEENAELKFSVTNFGKQSEKYIPGHQ